MRFRRLLCRFKRAHRLCFDFSSGVWPWAEARPRWVRIDSRRELIAFSPRSSLIWGNAVGAVHKHTGASAVAVVSRRQSAARGLISEDAGRLPRVRVCQEEGKGFWLKKITARCSGKPRGDTDLLLSVCTDTQSNNCEMQHRIWGTFLTWYDMSISWRSCFEARKLK